MILSRVINSSISILQFLLLFVCVVVIVDKNNNNYNVSAFAPPSSLSVNSRQQQPKYSVQQQQQQQKIYNIIRSSASTSSLYAAASVTSNNKNNSNNNLFKKLPWNVKKEKEREQRRLILERSKLHRQLGIVEDATYEEIVEATDKLIRAAGTNLKEKVKIEIAKDKILQIRLNERLAGLTLNNKEAKAMSSYESDGVDDDDDYISKKKNKEWNAPSWTKGLIVKPDEKHLKSQIRLWGILTLIGAALPPAQDYLGRFTWLVCVAQLTFRGMPQEMREGGGMGMSFNMSGGKGGHRKIAFALGFGTWIVGAIIAYGLMPTWARGQRWTSTAAFTIQNLIFGIVSSYLQPYKG